MFALRPYIVGLGLLVLFTAVKMGLPSLGRDVPFVLYFAPPLVAALQGGRWPGLVTSAAGAFVGDYFFLAEQHANAPAWERLLPTGTFFGEAAIVVWICDTLLRTRTRLLMSTESQLARERALGARVERLYRLTTAFASAMTTEAVADRVSQLAATTVGSDSVSLYLVDEAAQVLVLQARHDDRPDLTSRGRISLITHFPLAAAVRDDRPRFFSSREEVAAEAPDLAEEFATSRYASWAILPLTSASGSVLGLLAFAFRRPQAFADEERQVMTAAAQQCGVALDRARAYEAEALALRKKDEFLAILGHELRNPLGPILNATMLIRLRGSASERELGILERQGSHLVRLVDDLLDVSRITSGKVTLRRVPLRITEVIAQSIESTGKLFEDKGLRLRNKAPSSGLAVRGDRERLVQVVTNLLINAAKFSNPGGSVFVTAERREGQVVITVRDEGRGIAPDLLPQVFDLFTQGAQPIDRRGGGLGLGLAIAKSIVLAHEGSIHAASEGEGKGATMSVHLPVLDLEGADTPSHGGPSPALPAPQRRSILIVDDNADGAEMLSTLLDSLGYSTLVATSAPEALRVVGERAPDAAILDIGLPGMNGYELATELRARFSARTPILVALSGYAQASDRSRSLKSGFSAHFGKPVDVEELVPLLERLLADKTTDDERTAAGG